MTEADGEFDVHRTCEAANEFLRKRKQKLLLAVTAVVALSVSSASAHPIAWAEASDACITRNVEAGNTGSIIQCHDYIWNRKTGTAILMCKGHLGGGEGTKEDRNVGGCRVDDEQEARLQEKCGVTECVFKAELEPHSRIVQIVGPVEYVTKRCYGRLIRKITEDVGPVIQVGDDPECTFAIRDRPAFPNKTGDYILKTCKPGDVCDLNVAVSDDYEGVLVGPVHRVK